LKTNKLYRFSSDLRMCFIVRFLPVNLVFLIKKLVLIYQLIRNLNSKTHFF